jgi:hypothetical protein
MKFGKREKIVVGSILGLLVIGALDLLVFRKAAESYQSLVAERERLGAAVSGAASVPPDFDAAKYNAETGRDESFMWKLVFGMDLITSQPLAVTMPKPVEPKLVSAEALLTMTATGGATDASIASTPQELETKRADYKVKKRAWDEIKKWKDTAIEGILARQIDRIVQMKVAYETGQPWAGDIILTDGTTATVNTQMTHPLRLNFLSGDKTSWQIPLQPSADVASLVNQAREVNNQFSLLTIINENDINNYMARLRSYNSAVTQLDPNMAQHMRQLSAVQPGGARPPSATASGPMVPVLAKIRLSHLIQQLIENTGQAVMLDNQTPLNAASLRKILKMDLPDDSMKLYYLHRQLFHLEKLMALARKNTIVSIDAVKLEREFNMVSYPSDALQQAQAQSSSPQATTGAGGAVGAAGAAGATPTVGATGQAMGLGLVVGVTGTVPGSQGYMDPYAEPEVLPDATGATPGAPGAVGAPGAMGGAYPGGRYGGGGGGGAYPGGRYGGGGAYPGGRYGGGMMGGGYGAAPGSPDALPAYVTQRTEVGMATLLTITFTAANKNAMQYLYEITRTPDHFRIEGFDIQAVGPDLVKVKVMVEAPATVKLLSNPKDSQFLEAGSPKKVLGDASTGAKVLAERIAWKKEILKMDVDDWMRTALQKAGLPLEEPPAPVEAAAPAAGAAGAAPGMPGGAAVPGAAAAEGGAAPIPAA